MKIQRAHVKPYRLPFAQPVRTAHGDLAERSGAWIVLVDAQGRRGCGDVAPLIGFGHTDPGAAFAACEKAAASVVGSSFASQTEVRALWRRGLPSEIIHGLELAALDLLAKERGQPLAQLWNPSARPRVPIAAVVHSATEARGAVTAGYETLKVKLLSSDDLDNLIEIRATVGPTIRLRADANGCLGKQVDILPRLLPLDLEWLEQPTPAGDLAALRPWLGRGVPIAVDETVAQMSCANNPHETVERLAGVEVLVLKPMFVGGLGAAWELAQHAASRGQRAVVSCAWESAVGRAGAAHLAAALEPDGAAGLSSPLGRDVAKLSEAGGTLVLPEVPGLGVEVALATGGTAEKKTGSQSSVGEVAW